MRPTLEQQDATDLWLGDAKLPSQDALGNVLSGVAMADDTDDIGCEFGHPMVFAVNIGSPTTTFARHVLAVRSRISKKQMVRAHARRVVAVVTDIAACGNWSVGQFPRDARRMARLASDTDYPIAKLGLSSCPGPAIASRIDFGPEAVAQGTWTARILVGHRGLPPVVSSPRLLAAVRGLVIRQLYEAESIKAMAEGQNAER